MDGLFIVYKRKTGRILQTMQGMDTEAAEELVESINADLPSSRQVRFIHSKNYNIDCEQHFVNSSLVPEKKTAFPQINVSNGCVSGLPRYTMVYWPDGKTSVPDDGKVEFDSNASMTMKLKLYHARYLTCDIEVKYVF